jgi:hypothetical protein
MIIDYDKVPRPNDVVNVSSHWQSLGRATNEYLNRCLIEPLISGPFYNRVAAELNRRSTLEGLQKAAFIPYQKETNG